MLPPSDLVLPLKRFVSLALLNGRVLVTTLVLRALLPSAKRLPFALLVHACCFESLGVETLPFLLRGKLRLLLLLPEQLLLLLLSVELLLLLLLVHLLAVVVIISDCETGRESGTQRDDTWEWKHAR